MSHPGGGNRPLWSEPIHDALQVLLFAPRAGALETWTTKKALPLAIVESANSCAAYGTFYYQYEGYNSAGSSAGRLQKYSSLMDTWASGTALQLLVFVSFGACRIGLHRITACR